MFNSFEIETKLKQDNIDYPYAGDIIFIVVAGSELLTATHSSDVAESRVRYINRITDIEIKEEGYVYVDRVAIPDKYTLEDYIKTCENDKFTYADIFNVLEKRDSIEEELFEDW